MSSEIDPESPEVIGLQDPLWSLWDAIANNASIPSLMERKEPTLWPSRLSVSVMEDGEEVIHGQCRRNTFLNYLERLHKYDPSRLSIEQLSVIEALKQIPKERSRELQKMGELGEAYEDKLIENTKECGLYKEDQATIYVHEFKLEEWEAARKLVLSGKVDIVLYSDYNDKYMLIECKSISPYWVDQCLGTKRMIEQKIPGKPKIAHLLQIAFYLWVKLYVRNQRDRIEGAKLMYVGRAFGEEGEYSIDVRVDPATGKHHIWYCQMKPWIHKWIKTDFTMESVLENASLIIRTQEEGGILGRDYSWILNEQEVHQLYLKRKLPAGERSKYEKRLAQIQANKTNAIKDKETEAAYDAAMEAYTNGEGDRPRKADYKIIGQKRVNKLPVRTTKACEYCDYQMFCFDEKGNPIND